MIRVHYEPLNLILNGSLESAAYQNNAFPHSNLCSLSQKKDYETFTQARQWHWTFNTYEVTHWSLRHPIKAQKRNSMHHRAAIVIEDYKSPQNI